MEDIFPSLHNLIFRSLNIGLKELENFKAVANGPETAILEQGQPGFTEVYKMLRSFYTVLPLENNADKIFVNKAVNFQGGNLGVIVNPVTVLTKEGEKITLMSTDSLMFYAGTWHLYCLHTQSMTQTPSGV